MSDLPLDAVDIAEFRELYEELAMPDTFRLVRETTTTDNEGGFTNTDTVVASGPCRLTSGGRAGQGSAVERTVADRLGWVAYYTIDLHPDVQVRTGDRIIVDGREFEIGGIVRAGAWSMVITAVVREIG